MRERRRTHTPHKEVPVYRSPCYAVDACVDRCLAPVGGKTPTGASACPAQPRRAAAAPVRSLASPAHARLSYSILLTRRHEAREAPRITRPLCLRKTYARSLWLATRVHVVPDGFGSVYPCVVLP